MEIDDSFLKKPGAFIMEIGHDDGCPMLSGGDHCTCKTTTTEILPVMKWVNRREKRRTEAEARRKKMH